MQPASWMSWRWPHESPPRTRPGTCIHRNPLTGNPVINFNVAPSLSLSLTYYSSVGPRYDRLVRHQSFPRAHNDNDWYIRDNLIKIFTVARAAEYDVRWQRNEPPLTERTSTVSNQRLTRMWCFSKKFEFWQLSNSNSDKIIQSFKEMYYWTKNINFPGKSSDLTLSNYLVSVFHSNRSKNPINWLWKHEA